MTALEEAKDKIERSMGDVRNVEHRDRLTELAAIFAAIAQAEAATRQAAALERIASVLELATDDTPILIAAPNGIGIKGPY